MSSAAVTAAGLRGNPAAAAAAAAAGLPPGAAGMPPFPFPADAAAAAAYSNGMNGLLHGNLSPGAAGAAGNPAAAGFRPNQLDALRMAQQFGPHAIAAMGLAHPALAAAAAQGTHAQLIASSTFSIFDLFHYNCSDLKALVTKQEYGISIL